MTVVLSMKEVIDIKDLDSKGITNKAVNKCKDITAL